MNIGSGLKKKGIIPKGTVEVRFKLISTYRWGARSNDGYFDALYFGIRDIENE